MRVKLKLRLDSPSIPKDNKSIWVSFFKSALGVYEDGKYLDTYFGRSALKDYTFTILYPKPKFNMADISLGSNHVTMIFSADDRKGTGKVFLNAFLDAEENKRIFRYKNGRSIVIEHVERVREVMITESKVLFKIVPGSGLCVSVHYGPQRDDQYYKFSDPQFSSALYNILVHDATKAGFSKEEAEAVKVTPVDCRKSVVQHFGISVVVTLGTLLIEGSSDILNYFYQAGFGSRHSLGYGLLDVLKQGD